MRFTDPKLPSFHLICLCFCHETGGFLSIAAAAALAVLGTAGEVTLFTLVRQLQTAVSSDPRMRGACSVGSVQPMLCPATTQLLSSNWSNPSLPVTSMSVHIPHPSTLSIPTTHVSRREGFSRTKEGGSVHSRPYGITLPKISSLL